MSQRYGASIRYRLMLFTLPLALLRYVPRKPAARHKLGPPKKLTTEKLHQSLSFLEQIWMLIAALLSSDETDSDWRKVGEIERARGIEGRFRM
jgi:hypothetical protein